jgi:hypothetical protein
LSLIAVHIRLQEWRRKELMMPSSSSWLIAASIAIPHLPPCVSLYQPTHRRRPENQQDPIRFRNLLKTAEASLRQRYPAHEVQALMQPFEALAIDRNFWNHTLDGLAILGALGFFLTFRLQRPVREFCVVADSFHVKPWLLLRSRDELIPCHALSAAEEAPDRAHILEVRSFLAFKNSDKTMR